MIVGQLTHGEGRLCSDNGQKALESCENNHRYEIKPGVRKPSCIL